MPLATDGTAEPRGEMRAAAVLVFIAIVIATAVSTTRSHGAPSAASPAERAAASLIQTPDAAPSGEAPALLQPAAAVADQAPAPRSIPRGADLPVTAAAFFAYDAETGAALAGRNADQERAIASTAKIATALVVVRYADLDEEVAIAPEDLVDVMVQSNMGLVAGDVLTVEQLLQGLLIPSGSDAANALARHVGAQLSGEREPEAATAAFVDAMNAYAQELGLEHTHFTNPSGDDDADAYSSARDLALLGVELMRNETLARIVAQAQYSFTSPGLQTLYEGFTTNQLLGQEGVVGLKTGSTGEAGGCVILARETGAGLQIISVLGSALTYQDNLIVQDARWDDARQIIAFLDA